MRGWSVAVSASTDPEACPLAVLEAMSLGIPVVATDHGGAPEVLAGAGLLVPPGDARALAEAVTRLLDDPDLRTRCAVRGRERVVAGHDLAQQTALLLHTLLGIASGEARHTRGGAR
jgi:glycosyltransferase involved in cell wall biosynthesis